MGNYFSAGISFPFILLFFCSLVLWVACDPPDDGGNDDGGNNRAPRTVRFEKTIIGLREFLLTVTANSAGTYEFILSNSSAAPAWSSVKDHPALITRSFSADKNYQREIYFSVTKDYEPPPHNAAVDLGTEPESKYPGFMSPGQQYYVHAYQNATHLKSSGAITTADYPDVLPAAITTESERGLRSTSGASILDSPLRALWGMKMWTKNIDDAAIIDAADNHGNKVALRRIEVGSGEILYLPIRSIQNLLDNTNNCTFGLVDKLFLRTGFNTGAEDSVVRLVYPPVAGNSYHPDNPEGDRSVLFHGHFQRPYYDMMAQIDTTQNYSRAWITSNCSAAGRNHILAPSFTLAAP